MINNFHSQDHIYVVNGYKKTGMAIHDPVFLSIISNYVDLSQHAVFKTTSGKPMVSGVHFSLAHSGDILVVGISHKSPVGIDVEQIKERKRHKSIAAKYGFTLGEVLEDFFREWVAREAFIKLRGSSIAQDLKKIRMSNDHTSVGIDDDSAFVSFFIPKAGYVGCFARKCLENPKVFFINARDKRSRSTTM